MSESRRYRLRSADADIALEGDRFYVGRGRDCQLVLDDPMVSRRHLVLFRDTDGVTIEDLGSRNGTLVNGVRIEGPQRLASGDRITVGAHQLTLEVAPRLREVRETLGAPRVSGAYERPPPTMRPPAPPAIVEVTQQANIYGMLISACDRALEHGDVRAAESAASNLVVSMRADLLRGRSPGQPVFDDLVGLALHLAERTGSVRWVDRVFEVFGTASRVMEAETIDRIHQVVMRQGFVVDQTLEAYLERLRRLAASLSEDERRRVVRLEQLAASA